MSEDRKYWEISRKHLHDDGNDEVMLLSFDIVGKPGMLPDGSNGFIKWDGCSQYWFGGMDAHVDDPWSHIEAIETGKIGEVEFLKYLNAGVEDLNDHFYTHEGLDFATLVAAIKEASDMADELWEGCWPG